MTAPAFAHRDPHGHHDPPERRFRRAGRGGGRVPALSRGTHRVRRLAQPQRAGVRVAARRDAPHHEPAPDRLSRRSGSSSWSTRPIPSASAISASCAGRADVETVVFDHHEAEHPERPPFVKGENWVISNDGAQSTSMLYILRERGSRDHAAAGHHLRARHPRGHRVAHLSPHHHPRRGDAGHRHAAGRLAGPHRALPAQRPRARSSAKCSCAWSTRSRWSACAASTSMW